MAADRRPYRLVRAGLVAGVLAALAPQAPAEPAGKPAAGKRAAATHHWVDGGARRTLVLEPALRADFSPKAAAAGVLRPSDGPLKDVAAPLQSPVLRDEGGRARALPGGVLVTLARPLDEAEARALIAAHGATPSRRIGDRLWLLESPAGLGSLELANRLAESGAFAAAQPNWWVERAKK